MRAFLIFILTILILIGLHEAGHFVAARLMKIKVLRFSIGFGKPLLLWYGKQGTEYAIAWLPLGGYVRLLNTREGNVSPADSYEAFDQKPLWRRVIVVLAGPVTNLIFAVFAFYLAYILGVETIKPIISAVTPQSIAAQANLKPGLQITGLNGEKMYDWGDVAVQLLLQLGNPNTVVLEGKPFPAGAPASYTIPLAHWRIDPLKPDLIKSLGIIPYRPHQPPVIGFVEPNAPASKAGLKSGDRIVTFNGQPVKAWSSLVHAIWQNPGKEILLSVKRADKSLTLRVWIAPRFSWKHFKTQGYLGIWPKPVQWPQGMKYERQYPFYQAFGPAVKEAVLILKLNAVTLAKIFTGKISLQNLGGPLLLYQAAHLAFKQGFVIFLNFLAMVSVMLGFVNLLPIPGLDGGHLLYFAIEKIRGKPLSIRLEALLVRLGMILLITLMVQVTVNDLVRTMAH